MKKLLLIALVFIGLNAKAQYFQHVYGTNSDDSLVSGINTVVQGQGYFKAGVNDFSCLMPNLKGIPASFTDVNGDVLAAPYFNREYLLTSKTGSYIEAYDPQVFEMDDSSGFGIIGRYLDPSIPSPNTGVFYLQLDPAGNPIATYSYPISIASANWDVAEVGGVRESVSGSGDSIYVTGTAYNSTTLNRHFALKIDVATGGLGWGWVYHFTHPLPWTRESWGKDIIENPFTNWTPSYEDLVVVGYKRDSMHMPNYNAMGFLTHLDAGTGISFPPLVPIPPVFYYGHPHVTNTHINSVTLSHDSSWTPPGFVMGGGTDEYGNMDFYVIKVDPHGNMMPGPPAAIDYSWNTGSNNDCFDVIERVDSVGKYTFFAGGYTERGYFGNRDAMVVKLDSFLNPIAGGEFTYGGAGDDYGKAMDTYNNNGANPPDGLSTFGTWNSGSGIGGQDLYNVRAYYNGVSGCNEVFSTSPWNPSGPMQPHGHADTITHFDYDTLGQLYVFTTDVTLCFSNTIPGGSNARVAPKNNGNTSEHKGNNEVANKVLVIPNPGEIGSRDVKLKVESDFSGKTDVIIYDMAGRQHYKGNFELQKGLNYLPIDISKSSMAAGMYKVVLNNGEKQLNTMLLLK